MNDDKPSLGQEKKWISLDELLRKSKQQDARESLINRDATHAELEQAFRRRGQLLWGRQ